MIYSNIFHLLASKSTQTNFYIVRLFTRKNEDNSQSDSEKLVLGYVAT